MAAPTATSEPKCWSGVVRLWCGDRLLGVLHVNLSAGGDDDGGPNKSGGSSWHGRVGGSDYLVWGTNLAKSEIEFPNGERAAVVLQAGGRLRGLGPLPALLFEDDPSERPPRHATDPEE